MSSAPDTDKSLEVTGEGFAEDKVPSSLVFRVYGVVANAESVSDR